MPANTRTWFPGGINDSPNESDPMQTSGIGLPDPTKWIVFFEDFIGSSHGIPIGTGGIATASAASPWIITVTDTGTVGAESILYADEIGGALAITTNPADNDNVFLQSRGEAFLWSATKRMYFEARVKVSNSIQSDYVVGLQIKDTTPLDVTDSFMFLKADDSTGQTFRSEKNNAGTNLTVGQNTSNTYSILGFNYNPLSGLFYVYKDRRLVGTVDNLNAVDDEELAISFGIQNGDGNARTFTVDYIFAAQER